jgi:hypothetical protein
MASLEDVFVTVEQLNPPDRLRLIKRLWETLPAEYWPERSDIELADVRRRLAKHDIQKMETVPWPIVERLLADCAHSTGSKLYAVPRRFDLATIFIVTLAYSLMFGVMSLLSFPPIASLLISGFITLVGAGQALLFRGNRPRAASLIIGATLYSLGTIAVWLYFGQRAYPPETLVGFIVFGVIFGAMLGYISGVIVGGVFLLADSMRRFVRSRIRRNDDSEPQDFPFDQLGSGAP